MYIYIYILVYIYLSISIYLSPDELHRVWSGKASDQPHTVNNQPQAAEDRKADEHPPGAIFANDATAACSEHNSIFEKARFGAATGNPKPCKLHRQHSNVQNYALGFKPSSGQIFEWCNNHLLKAQQDFWKSKLWSGNGKPQTLQVT